MFYSLLSDSDAVDILDGKHLPRNLSDLPEQAGHRVQIVLIDLAWEMTSEIDMIT